MKVLWGFAPFQQNRVAIKGMFEQIRQLASSSKNVIVGYVVTGNDSHLNTAFDIPLEERFSVYPKNLIANELKSAKVPIVENQIHTVQFQTLSVTKSVDRFLSLAKSQKVDLLALFTQGKTGLSRFFLGSFVETAIHRSPLNLLIMNPKAKAPAKIKNIFFASDFSESSKKDLLQVLKICKSLDAKLTVFHAAEFIYTWPRSNISPRVEAYRAKTDKMADWVQQASKKAKVPCEVVVRSEFKTISELALKWAKRSKAHLLVVSAEASPAAALMGGSITRQIVRNGKYAVLVIKRRKGSQS